MRSYLKYIVLPVIFLLIIGSYAHAKTVGAIMTADIEYYRDIHKAFTDALGKDAEVVLQKPMPDPMSWTNAARKLTGIGANVIVSYGAPATLTLIKETPDIPIIFGGVYDPESMGLTGKNATGISSTVPVDKLLKGLSEISKFSKLGIIFSKSEKDTIIQVRDLKKSEGSLGFESVLFGVTDKVNKDEIKGVNAFLLTTCAVGMSNVKDVIEVARRDKIPTAALTGGGENAGVVLTIVADPAEQGKELAAMVKKILGGAKPSDITLVQPKNIEIIINDREFKEDDTEDRYPASVETVPGNPTTADFRRFYLHDVLDLAFQRLGPQGRSHLQARELHRGGRVVKIPSHTKVSDIHYQDGYAVYNNDRRQVLEQSKREVEYSIAPPYELTAGAAINLWILTATAEASWIDYTQIRYASGGELPDLTLRNKEFADKLRGAINLNAGAEFPVCRNRNNRYRGLVARG